MFQAIKAVALLVIIALVLYGSWQLYYTGSYTLWYEGMVKKTISETVKDECLINKER
jgi:hypothetical protein